MTRRELRALPADERQHLLDTSACFLASCDARARQGCDERASLAKYRAEIVQYACEIQRRQGSASRK